MSETMLANELGKTQSEISAFLKNRFGIYKDTQHIVGYLGLAISKMGYLIEFNGQKLSTWCAWDSLFIPELFGSSATVSSTDPITKPNISMVVTRNGIENLSPSETVMSVLIPKDTEAGEFEE